MQCLRPCRREAGTLRGDERLSVIETRVIRPPKRPPRVCWSALPSLDEQNLLGIRRNWSWSTPCSATPACHSFHRPGAFATTSARTARCTPAIDHHAIRHDTRSPDHASSLLSCHVPSGIGCCRWSDHAGLRRQFYFPIRRQRPTVVVHQRIGDGPHDHGERRCGVAAGHRWRCRHDQHLAGALPPGAHRSGHGHGTDRGVHPLGMRHHRLRQPAIRLPLSRIAVYDLRSGRERAGDDGAAFVRHHLLQRQWGVAIRRVTRLSWDARPPARVSPPYRAVRDRSSGRDVRTRSSQQLS